MNRYFGLGIIFLSITASAAKAQPVVDSGLAEFTQVEFYAVGVEIVCTKAELDASGIKFDGTWSGDNTFTTSATWAFPGTVDSYEGRLFRSIRGRLQSRGLKVVGTDEDRDNTSIFDGIAEADGHIAGRFQRRDGLASADLFRNE